MRNLLYILSILISNQLFSATFFVDQNNTSCDENGVGTSVNPFCTIQSAINSVQNDQTCPNAYSEVDDALNFTNVCTVQVASGTYTEEELTYTEELTIIKDMVIISAAAAAGHSLQANNIDTFIGFGLPTIAPPSSSDAECISSTITIRPDPNDQFLCTNPDICGDSPPAFKAHPHVKINGFIIESGKGSGITDGVTGQYSRVGGAIFAYLSIPQVNNCIFKGGEENQSGNLIYYSPDPDDIIYPAAKPEPEIGRDECSFDDNSFGAIIWPITWDINLSQNSYDYDCYDTDGNGNCDPDSEGSIDKPLVLPQIFINGFTNNKVDLTNCLFTVYNTVDATTGVSEYWVKGRIKEGEKVEFDFSGSVTANSPMLADIITVNPNLLGGDDCDVNSNECNTIHAALARIIPSPNSPKIIQLPSASTYSVNTAIPIIDGISIIGTSDGSSKPKLISSGTDRLFICQDMQNPIVTYRNLEIREGVAPNYGDGGAILLDNCSLTFENVDIVENSSEGKGGGMYLVNNSNPHLKTVKINNNTAEENGGGIYCDSSNPIIDNESKINGNKTSGEKGAGIFSTKKSYLQLNNVEIKQNSIENQNAKGAGIYIEDVSNLLQFNLVNVEIDSNFSVYNSDDTNMRGIGIYILESSGNITGGYIKNNGYCTTEEIQDDLCSTPDKGGGIFVSESEITINNVVINNNWADEEGAGVYFVNSHGTKLIDVEISNNHDKGGVYISSTYGFILQDCKIHSNDNYGIKNDYSSIKMLFVEVTDNGIGIESNESDFYIQNVTIAGNSGFGITSSQSSVSRDGDWNIVNSILWNNQIEFSGTGSQTLMINYSNYAGDNYAGQEGLLISGDTIDIIWGTDSDAGIENTNLDAWEIDHNPKFTDSFIGDYTLLEDSHCIDRGSADIDGYGFEDITDYYCQAPDMGAYELYSTNTGEADFADIDQDGVCNVLDTGCTDSNACNYDPDATNDDGACIYAQENYDCDGNCLVGIDCAGVCGGDAVDDACGVCGGDGSDDVGCGCFEPAPSGCDNTCGSTLVFDECGECNGDGSSCLAGCTYQLACNYDETAIVDDGSCTFVENDCAPCIDGEIIDPDGDTNEDGAFNVLDIVILANCVLVSCSFECIMDMNLDGLINILDIVILINDILGGGLVRGGTTSEARIMYGNGLCRYETDGTIAGIELHVDGYFDIKRNNLPAGWEIHVNESMILMYSLDGSHLEDKLLFEYAGDFNIESVIIADWQQSDIFVELEIIPDEYVLSHAYPNPFNPTTNIDFGLPADAQVIIQIYNINGRLLSTLINGYKHAGNYSLSWNANKYSSGLYFVKMTVATGNDKTAIQYSAIRKLLLLK